ncbi:MAG: hypothetical protein ACLSAP_09770 [Oscillospiraceae bacterium]
MVESPVVPSVSSTAMYQLPLPQSCFAFKAAQDGVHWTKIAEKTGDGTQPENGDVFELQNCTATAIKIKAVQDPSASWDPLERTLSISEIRVYGEGVLPTLDQLANLVAYADTLDVSANDANKIAAFGQALKAAKEAIALQAAPDEVTPSIGTYTT